jgi:TonB family protein
MRFACRVTFSVATGVIALVLFSGRATTHAQAPAPLTYPEIVTALQTKLPNQVFKNRSQLTAWVISQIQRRKLDQPLTKEREDDLRQAGATAQLMQVVRSNSPALPPPEPKRESGPVELGDLMGRVTNLVKPEYTPEARRAGTFGEVKLALDIDETGKVTSVARLTVLENGLTESAIQAARLTTFQPATRDGKPARGTGIMLYNFKLNQVDVGGTLAAADDLRNKRDCERAVIEYNRVLEFEPKHARALLGRGMCYLIGENYNKAVTDLNAAAASNDRDADIFVFLALALDFRGDGSVASDNYEKALKLQPGLDDQPAFTCLYIDRRSLTPEQVTSSANGIINACTQALRSPRPELSLMLQFKRGIGHRIKGDFDKAIADFEKVRAAAPQFASINTQLQVVFNNRGLAAFNKKDYKRAFDDVSAAIQFDPKNPATYVNRCAIYLYGSKQYKEAINDCSAAIRLGTRSSSAYTHRGYANEMIKNRDAAIMDYTKALEMNPQDQRARDNLNRLQPPRLKN